MEEVLSAAGASGGEPVSPVGSWERPDAAGIVRRGSGVGFIGHYVEQYGEPPVCLVGSRTDKTCERPAVMEVYGIIMCGQHGEEAASGALAEIAYDLENELQRPMNPYVAPLSPHLERALRHGFESLPVGGDDEHAEAALLEAFPLDRARASSEVLEYVRDPDGEGRRHHQPPSAAYMEDRMLLHHHMRLAFEKGATWLVEMLEREREEVAAQVAYALALEREAGLRSGISEPEG